jgi:hypothetical protein
MCKYTWIVVVCISLLLMGGNAGCDTNSAPMGFDAPDLITVALPYVEAVHFPAAIHAGQPFSITVDLSCAINPLALRSPEHPFPQVDHGNGATSVTITPFRDLTRASSSLPVLSSVTYDFDPLPAGICNLYYMSVGTREQGGMNVLYDRKTQSAWNFNALNYSKSLEFTVLP